MKGDWLAGGSCKRYKPVFQRLCCFDLFSVAEGSGADDEEEQEEAPIHDKDDVRLAFYSSPGKEDRW